MARLNVSGSFGDQRVTWKGLNYIIENDIKNIIKDNTHELKNDLRQAWPVATGRSRAGWHVRGNQYTWSVANNVTNPDTGFYYIAPLWYGSSQQMPQGGDPIVRRRALLLRNELRRHKWNKRRRRYDPIRTSSGHPDIRV